MENNNQTMRELLMQRLRDRLNQPAPEPEKVQDDAELESLQESQSDNLRNIGLIEALNTAQQGVFGKRNDSRAFDPAREQAKQGLKDYLARRAEETKRNELANKLRQDRANEELNLLKVGASMENQDAANRKAEEARVAKEKQAQAFIDEKVKNRQYREDVKRIQHQKRLTDAKIPQSLDALDNIDAMLASYVDKEGNPVKDIPGVGRVAGGLHAMLLSPAGNQLRGDLERVAAPIRQAFFGATLTGHEKAAFDVLQGKGGGISDESFIKGMKRLREMVLSNQRAIENENPDLFFGNNEIRQKAFSGQPQTQEDLETQNTSIPIPKSEQDLENMSEEELEAYLNGK